MVFSDYMNELPSLKEAVRLAPAEAFRRAFRFNLTERERIDSQVSVWPTTVEEQKKTSWLALPDGIIVSTDRNYHGAEVHLSWEEARVFTNELLRLLGEHDSAA